MITRDLDDSLRNTSDAQSHDAPSAYDLRRQEMWVGAAEKIQWVIFAVACLLAFCLHIVLYQHAGAFWRDETSSIQLARVPSLSSMWSSLGMDSFPALFVSLLRLWISLGPGATDFGIRLLGVLISLGVIAAAFASCRAFRSGVPLFAIALIAFNKTILYYGSSIRAYGLAALLILLCFAAFWRLVKHATGWNATVALVLATLSVHSNYQNCYLLFGIGTAAATVCAFERQWKRTLLLLWICFLAALSMSIYIPTIVRYRNGIQIAAFSREPGRIARTLAESLAGGSEGLLISWLLLLLVAVICPVVQFLYRRRTGSDSSALLPQFYCLLTLIVAGASGFAFFKFNGMLPYGWHYMPFMTLLAVIVETNVHLSQHAAWTSLAKAGLACCVVGLSFSPAWEQAHVRRTNVDLVSAAISRQAGSNDLVLVSPFYFASSFNYYYHGAASWTTLPAVAADDRGSYGACKELMMTPNAINPTLQIIQKTLAAGNRLWLVGALRFLPPNTLAPYLPPAPQSQFGWNHVAYTEVWMMQAGLFVQTNALRAQEVPMSIEQPVSELENLPLILIEGWRRR